MRALRAVHAWAGVTLALLVATIALSGTLLVFKADYLRAVYPAARQAPTTDAASLAQVLQAAEREFGPTQVRSVVFGTAEMGLHRVYLRDGGGAYLDAHGGAVVAWRTREPPEIWLFDLHQNLLAGDAGHALGGSIGLATALLALAGLLLWLPGARSFRGALWPRSARRSALIAHHRDLGAVTALPALLIALTGAAMVFDAPARTALRWAVPGGGSLAPVATAHGRSSGVAIDWRSRLELAQAQHPTATLRIVTFPDEQGAVHVRLKQRSEWHPNGRTRVRLSAATGLVLESVDATRQPSADQAFDALYPIHSAQVGGRAYDAIAAGTGLALAALALVGGATFLRLRFRRVRPPRAASLIPHP